GWALRTLATEARDAAFLVLAPLARPRACCRPSHLRARRHKPSPRATHSGEDPPHRRRGPVAAFPFGEPGHRRSLDRAARFPARPVRESGQRIAPERALSRALLRVTNVLLGL